jgi:hypothetical protein
MAIAPDAGAKPMNDFTTEHRFAPEKRDLALFARRARCGGIAARRLRSAFKQ